VTALAQELSRRHATRDQQVRGDQISLQFEPLMVKPSGIANPLLAAGVREAGTGGFGNALW
jgi:hypothetical protein